MKFGYSKTSTKRDSFSVRIAGITGCTMMVLLALGAYSGFLQKLHSTVGLPVDFKIRQLLDVAPPVNSRIKIVALDDSTYAYLQKPYLTGDDWAQIFRTIGTAQPRAIVTTHMFGTGEFSIPGNPLARAIRQLKRNGTDIIAGSFAYPLKISYRKPLNTERPEFVPPRPEISMNELPGWTLYGPDAEHAHLFTGIGHLSYDGEARIAGYQKITDQITVPHISLVTAGILGIDTVPRVDASGRLLINLPQISHLMKSSKSMKFLLGTDGNEWAQKSIVQGDIVLLLSDMYTGKVNFVGTPLGPIPSGYIVASAINSVLQEEWIVDRTEAYGIIAIFLLLGITCGMAPNLIWFSASIIGGTMLIPALGLLTFAVSSVVLPWLASTIFFTCPAALVFFKRTHTRMMLTKLRNIQVEKETEKLNAIVRTAQMFAHDVRKPFSMLNMTAQSIQKLTDTNEILAFMNRMLPELDRAMTSVEGMIQDIMEIDSNGSLNPESTSIELLLSDCLRDAFVQRNNSHISLTYRLLHSHDIDIDRLKVKRVIVNIVDNALQAMAADGTIWISTCDILHNGASFVEIIIGNSGTYIEPTNLKRIFEAFFTNGKKGGTGLGLAIAQKVVMDHGGQISARSDKEAGTEFIFSLPISHTTPISAPNKIGLPQNSGAFFDLAYSEEVRESSDAKQTNFDLAHGKLISLQKSLGRAIRILVIDDEPVYLESMKTILNAGVFANLIESASADSAATSIELAQHFTPDLILCDIDMGPRSASGFEIVEHLRLDGISAYIVMHSNRIFQLDSIRASDAGANSFLPKPINEYRLMTIIIEGLSSVKNSNVPAEIPAKHKDLVVVVDDDIFTLEAWETILDDAGIMTFSGPTKFWEFLAANKLFINDIKLIVTDYHFDNEPIETGESFAARIKEIGNIPVVLSSNGSFNPLPAVFDASIGKEPNTYRAIRNKILKAG